MERPLVTVVRCSSEAKALDSWRRGKNNLTILKYTPESAAVLMGAHSLPAEEQQLPTWFLLSDSA